MKLSEAKELIPKVQTSSKIDPSKLIIEFIAPPKWGKTTFFMSNPDAVLLAFEEGHKFQKGYKMIIDCWDQRGGYESWVDDEGCSHMSMIQAVEALEKVQKFSMAIIDTTDMAAKMCQDFHCARLGVSHPSEAGDYGKGYALTLNDPFRQLLLRLQKTGRGIGFITHTKVEIAKFTSGEKARKESRLPGGVKHFVESQADIILHGEHGKSRPGFSQRDRIVVCEGDQDIEAGNRSGTTLPARYIAARKNQWAQFQKFFTDKAACQAAENEFRQAKKEKLALK